MSDQLVTVATFNFATDPDFLLLKARLREENIPFNTAEENTVGVDPLLSITVGGIRVLVNKRDAPRALEIVEDLNHADEGEENVSFQVITPDWEPAPESDSWGYLLIVGFIIALLLLALLFTVLREL